MSTLTKLPPDHTEAEGAIVIPDDLKAAIIQEDPDFAELMSQRSKLLRKVDKWVPVEDPEDSPRMEEAKRLRLDLMKVRTTLDKLRKSVGERAHRVWKATNDFFRPVLEENAEAEDYLKESEEFAKRYEQSRKAELAAERKSKLVPFLLDPLEADALNLGEITEETFGHILSGAKMAFDERAQKMIEERLAREADKRRAEEAEKILADERRAHEAELQKQRDEQAAKDAEARRVQAEANAKLAEERRKTEALEAEKRQQEADAKKKADEERKAVAKAARAPDKVKLAAWLATIRDALAEEPRLKDPAVQKLRDDFFASTQNAVLLMQEKIDAL